MTRRPASAIATATQTTFCRGDGGFGGPPREAPPVHAIPERAPDLVCDLPTRPETALIYRLSGDPNPLHVDPAVAKAAGFPRPILHGLATFGIAGHAILKTPVRLRSGAAYGDRRPVLGAGVPGRDHPHRDVARWAVVSFRARVVERDVVALNNGRAEIIP